MCTCAHPRGRDGAARLACGAHLGQHGCAAYALLRFAERVLRLPAWRRQLSTKPASLAALEQAALRETGGCSARSHLHACAPAAVLPQRVAQNSQHRAAQQHRARHRAAASRGSWATLSFANGSRWYPYKK